MTEIGKEETDRQTSVASLVRRKKVEDRYWPIINLGRPVQGYH